MTKRVVEHKIKLEKSVKIILGVLAFGVFLNAFAEMGKWQHTPVYIKCVGGCK